MTTRNDLQQQPTQQQVVKVRREPVATCMTCPLCHKLFRDATTITECLHTFCRECIYSKITDDWLESCPVCNIEIGCAKEKLRTDHSLNHLRSKIFPSRGQKAPESVSSHLNVVPKVPTVRKRKERSLSSLVANTPIVSEEPVLTRKNWKSIARKAPALRESFISNEVTVKKVKDCQSSPETLIEIAKSVRQNASAAKLCMNTPCKGTDNNNEPCEEQADLLKPLNFLVDASKKTKSNKSKLRENRLPKMLPNPHKNEAQVFKSIFMEHDNGLKVNGDENSSTPIPGVVKHQTLQASQKKEGAITEGLKFPTQTVVDSNCKYDAILVPIWFSLIASDNQEGPPLPQISSCYLRVRDGRATISSIKMYLAQKLGLSSESEVEISLHGQPVASSLQLHEVLDRWLKMLPVSERMQTTMGSSGKDFVMVLSYSRKAQPHKKH